MRSIADKLLAVGLVLACLACAGAPVAAATIGVETFDYANGGIAGKTGGYGFDYDNTTENDPFIGHTGTTSDWGGAATVSNGTLVTNNNNALRQYNGPTEGSATGRDERYGAVNQDGNRDAHIVVYAFDMTRAAGNSLWGGASSYDFGAERIFFGVPSDAAANDTIGIAQSGVGTTLGSMNLTDGQTYRMVAVLDFDNDNLGLFVNPDASDYWNRSTGSNTADVTRAYTATNWSTAIRLASGATTTWDNLVVATTFNQILNRGVVFADDFNEADGTAVPNKLPDVGPRWSQTSGAGLTVQNDKIDTQGGARVLFGTFERALSHDETFSFDFVTADTNGAFHSGGWAGISLYAGGVEQIFIGDPGNATEWGLGGAQFPSGLNTGVVGEAMHGLFLYSFNTGAYQFFLDDALLLSGAISPGLALDSLRIANNSGGDIAVDSLDVRFGPVPEPVTMALLGLASCGLGGYVRRRRAL